MSEIQCSPPTNSGLFHFTAMGLRIWVLPFGKESNTYNHSLFIHNDVVLPVLPWIDR